MTTGFGGIGVGFPLDLSRAGDRRELAVDFVDQGPDREAAQAKRPGALDDPGVVEVAAGEPQQVVAERDHGQEMAALIGRDRRRRLARAASRIRLGARPTGDRARGSDWTGSTGALPDRSGADALCPSLRSRRTMRLIGHPWPARLCAHARLQVRTDSRSTSSAACDSIADSAGSRRTSWSRDDDLIGQKRMAVGQVEHRLLSQLLRVVGARASLEDDFLIGVNNVKVTNPTIGDAVDVTLDELGEFLMVLAESEPPKLCTLELYIAMPVSHLIGFTAGRRCMRKALPNEQIGEAVSRPSVHETGERQLIHQVYE